MIAKDTVVPVLVAEWAAIDDLLTSLREDQWALPTALPGWSVQDNVAHLVGTECALAGQAPPPCEADVRAFPHVRNDIGAANELWVQGLRAERPARVLERFRDATAVRREALEAMTQADFDAPSWTPPATTRTAGSCGSGCSTAGCTSRTSARRPASRATTTGRARSWP
jgi:uncharacterized protein (TIGR03083 family)